jgi:hypothetical protein
MTTRPRQSASQGAPAQAALFGDEVVPPQRGPVPMRAVTNDVDLIESVITTATDPGYLLVGNAERVYRRDPQQGERIERVPDYEDVAVHQLLHGRALSRGAREHVRHGRHEGTATAVTVPKPTAQRAARWRAYQRLPQ